MDAIQADIQASIAQIKSAASVLNLAEIQLGYTRLPAPLMHVDQPKCRAGRSGDAGT